jgi:hypothetical protein
MLMKEPHVLPGALALATGVLRHGVAARNTNSLFRIRLPRVRHAIRLSGEVSSLSGRVAATP